MLPVVRKTEANLAENPAVNHEYLPACGHSNFTKAAAEFLLGKDSLAIKENRVLGFQSISGTGAFKKNNVYDYTTLVRIMFILKVHCVWARNFLLMCWNLKQSIYQIQHGVNTKKTSVPFE